MIKSDDEFLVLIADGLSQSRMNKRTGLSDFEYIEVVESVFKFNPSIKKVLLGGLGAGTVIRHCLQSGPHVRKIVAVELDPEIIQLERKFVAETDGISASQLPGVMVVHDDFMHYLKRNRSKWDLIFIDCFYHVSTAEVYPELIRLIRDRLSPDGILAINVFSLPREFPNMVESLMGRVFSETVRVPCTTTLNTILLGSGGAPAPLRRSSLRQNEVR